MNCWAGTGWSDLLLISVRATGRQWHDFLPGFEEYAGVYRLVALRPNEHEPTAIRRVCEADSTGTLYIGASRRLKNRLTSLVNTYSGDCGGGSHVRMADVLSNKYPWSRLALTCRREPECPFEAEYDLMGNYVARFGEPPPLNGYGRYPPGKLVLRSSSEMVDAVPPDVAPAQTS